MTKPAELDYRKRYLALADELAAREREWADLDQRLRRVLSLLLIVAEGPLTPDLAAVLVQLRDSLKAGLDLPAVEQSLETIKRRMLEESRWAERSEGFPPVHEILIHVVERLPLPPDMAEEALAVVERFEPGLAPEQLPDAIDAVAGLVYGVRVRMREEKRELEALLLEVNGRLQELAGGVRETDRETQAGFAATRSWMALLDREMVDLEASSREASDLAALRRSVQASLDSLRAHLEAKRTEDRRREARLRDEVDRLHRTIHRLEEEVDQHREQTRMAREMSLRDPLTGCHNRLAYEERAQAELARWQRYGAPLSLILFDLDHFKRINDTFGHKAGDQVLKTFTQIAGNQLRQVDFFCRYGGEEFVALLPETPLEAAVTVAEKVRRAVEAFRFHSRGKRVKITLSCGVAQLREGDTMETAFHRADAALYRAKDRGRNCTRTEDAGGPS
ncbi:MAG: hypothetical protein Kow0092_32570 [Deferrisomatales bacterium]